MWSGCEEAGRKALPEKQVCLIRNADWILTMDEQRTRYRHADLLYAGREILEIGPSLEEKYRGRCVFDSVYEAAGRIVLPGFVNAHHHTWQALIRNIHITQGLTLEPWLKVMYEIYRYLTPDAARAGVYASLGDCLKTGCTSSNDLWYPHPVGVHGLMDAEIEAAAELGIRFHPIRSYHSQVSRVVPPEVVDTTERVMEEAARLVETYHDRGRFSMCRVGIGPSIAQYDTEEILQATLDFAEKYDVMVHGHLAESRFEWQYTKEHFGCTPVEWFREHGLLGRRFYYAHGVQLDETDRRILAETGTGIVSCPISNMYLSSGACPVRALMDAGVRRLALGVDGPASSNSSNMMEEMRAAYLVSRLCYGETPCTTEDILYMATAGGAAALGRDDIGSLRPGMAADITILDWDRLSWAGGCYDPADCIVLSGDARMVDRVIVNGQTVVSGGRLTRGDEEEKKEYVNAVGRELLARASARLPGLRQDLGIK